MPAAWRRTAGMTGGDRPTSPLTGAWRDARHPREEPRPYLRMASTLGSVASAAGGDGHRHARIRGGHPGALAVRAVAGHRRHHHRHHRLGLGHRPAHLRALLRLVGRLALAQATDGGQPRCWSASPACSCSSSPPPSGSSSCASSPVWPRACSGRQRAASLVDATDPGSRGQAFGYFSAFQMGGFVLGPAIGAFGTSIFGGYAFPFLFMGVLGFVSAAFLWRFQSASVRTSSTRCTAEQPVDSPLAKTGIHATAAAEPRFVADEEPVAARRRRRSRPSSTACIMAAVIIGFGLQLTFGIYDVVWPLYLIDLGASVEWVGVTFMLIGIPSMILAPLMGRWVDRYGSIPFVIAGCLVMIGAGIAFASAWEPMMPSVAATFEAGFSAPCWARPSSPWSRAAHRGAAPRWPRVSTARSGPWPSSSRRWPPARSGRPARRCPSGSSPPAWHHLRPGHGRVHGLLRPLRRGSAGSAGAEAEIGVACA